jgi:hypothetical protein
MPHPWPLILFIIVLVCVAAGSAALLRAAGMNRLGARSIGGILAGLLLGPSIGGAMFPEVYRQHIRGGHEQQRSLEQHIRRHDADRLAAEHARVDFDEYQHLRQQQNREQLRAAQEVTAAEIEHQYWLRGCMVVFIVIVLVSSGLLSREGNVQRPQWAMPLSVGLWAAAVPGGIAFAAAYWWWDGLAMGSALFAAGVAVGPWALSRQEATVADEVEIGGAGLIQNAGRVASTMAIILTIGATLLTQQSPQWWWSTVLLAMPVGWAASCNRRFSNSVRAREEWMVANFDLWIIPGLAAMITVHLDFIRDFSVWPVLLAAILSSDGRWLGAVLGAMLPGGRTMLRTMRLVIPSMAAGPNQLAIAGIALLTGAVPVALVVAVVIGAGLVDLTSLTRRRLADQLARTEDELNHG